MDEDSQNGTYKGSCGASLSCVTSGTSNKEIWKLVSKSRYDVSFKNSSAFSPSLGVIRIDSLVSTGDIGLTRRI